MVTAYQGRKIEMVREGKRGGWRYSVVASPEELCEELVGVGPFETSGAAYQHAVRRLNMLGVAERPVAAGK